MIYEKSSKKMMKKAKLYAIKIYGGSGGIAPPFLTLELDGGEWSALRTGHFTFMERAPGSHWIGGWVDHRAGLNIMEKRKILPGMSHQLSYPNCLEYGSDI
jgi:hypothetical protein